jgi:hypothetical protein
VGAGVGVVTGEAGAGVGVVTGAVTGGVVALPPGVEPEAPPPLAVEFELVPDVDDSRSMPGTAAMPDPHPVNDATTIRAKRRGRFLGKILLLRDSWNRWIDAKTDFGNPYTEKSLSLGVQHRAGNRDCSYQMLVAVIRAIVARPRGIPVNNCASHMILWVRGKGGRLFETSKRMRYHPIRKSVIKFQPLFSTGSGDAQLDTSV